MKTSTLLIIACCVAGVLAVGANGADIQLVPITADGPHHFDGTEIVLEGGGQRVFLEIFIWGWDPDLDEYPMLKTWQAVIDSNGYYSGDLGTIGPADEPCTGNAECVTAFGSGATCGYPVGVNTHCTPGFIEYTRTDYIFFATSEFRAVDLYSLDFRFGSTLVTPETMADGGAVYYAGSLVLDVPIGAIGTFTVHLKPDPDSFLKDPNLWPITPLVLTPAEITVECQTDPECDDGNACTNDDCLGNGTCAWSPNYNQAIYCCNPATGDLTEIDDDNECTEDICDPDTGIVTHPPVAYGTPCGPPPSDECDAQDICDGNGTCLPIWAPGGTACGSQVDTDCTNPDTCDGSGNCDDNHEPPDTPCGDSTDDDCTDPDTCDGDGNCDENHEPPGTPCGDPTDTGCDNPDSCDGDGTCLDNCEPNGTTCDDGQYCNVGETCQNCECGGGNPRNCSDGRPCTTDWCNETDDQCENDLDPGFCLIGGICRDQDQENPANECEECNPQLSTSTWSPKPPGSSCGSGADTDCTDPDTCDGAGDCQDNHAPPGTACNDQSDTDCTDPDTCNAVGGCEPNHEPNGTPCDDLLYCNVGEACLNGNCFGGSARNCSDGVPCTDDWCDEPGDTCVNDPNDANCNNGQWCDGVEICDDVLNCIVQPGTVPDCDDQIGCTDDWCNEVDDQCENDANDANCNDGQYCNGVEICSEVEDCIIQPGSVPDCDDLVGCTDDSCDEVNDECDNDPNDAHCPDDEEFCNGTEYCDPVTDCDHTGNPCAGPCDPIIGCLCESPVVDYGIVNPRYIPVALQPPTSGEQGIVLTVECPGGPVTLYVGEPTAVDLDGDTMDDESVAFVTTDPAGAARRTPAEWGELYVTGELIVPDTTYTIQGDCGPEGSPALSDPTWVTTAVWGDVVGDYISGEWTPPNGVVDFLDINSVVERFKNTSYAPPINRTEMCGPSGNECVPSQLIDFLDILSCVEAFRGKSYLQTWQFCSEPCE